MQLNFPGHSVVSYLPAVECFRMLSPVFTIQMIGDYWHLFASQHLVALRLAMMGVSALQKLANITCWGFSFRHLPECADEQSNK